MRLFRFSLLLAASMLVSSTSAGDWPHWRGPNYNGSADEKNLPVKFSRTDNVTWAVDMPGPSAATPIIVGDKVFVSSTDAKNEALVALCLDRKTGKTLWQSTVGKGTKQDYRSTFAAPSPVTDGKLVVFFYGNGEMATFDLDGKKLWNKNFGPFAFQWTFSSSPLLYGGKLYLQVLQRNVQVRGKGPRGRDIESYLLAIDPKSGKTLWRHVRPSKAVAESLEAFTSPVPMEGNGRKELLIAGGDALTGHDPETGKELWRWGTWNPNRITHWRLVPSPVASEDVILACAPKGDPIYSVKAGGKGNLDNSALAWVSRANRAISSDVATPAFYDGDFFVLADLRRIRRLSRVEPKTGKVKWSVDAPGRSKYEASPLAADGKIYLMNFDGEVVVVSAKDGKILHQVAMQERAERTPVRSSISAAHGQLFIRTNQKLYCVGK